MRVFVHTQAGKSQVRDCTRVSLKLASNCRQAPSPRSSRLLNWLLLHWPVTVRWVICIRDLVKDISGIAQWTLWTFLEADGNQRKAVYLQHWPLRPSIWLLMTFHRGVVFDHRLKMMYTISSCRSIPPVILRGWPTLYKTCQILSSLDTSKSQSSPCSDLAEELVGSFRPQTKLRQWWGQVTNCPAPCSAPFLKDRLMGQIMVKEGSKKLWPLSSGGARRAGTLCNRIVQV